MIFVKCSCGRTVKVGSEHAGKKLRCPACGAISPVPGSSGSPQKQRPPTSPSTKPAPAKRKKKRRQESVAPPVEELEELEEISDEDNYGLDDYGEPEFDSYPQDDNGDFGFDDYAAAMPSRPRKKSSGKKNPNRKKEKTAKGSDVDGIPPKVMYSLLGFAGLVVVVAVALVGRSIVNTAAAEADSMAIPEQFERWKHDTAPLATDHPADWAMDAGGGSGNVPPWVKIENEDQGVRINIRASNSGTAISDIANAGGTLPDELGGDLPDELAPIAQVHAFQKEMIGADYDEYEEGDPRKIETGFGEGRISDFTGSKLFTKTHGVRATLVSNLYQYNVVCTCPQERLEEYRPVFEKIIKSIGP